MKITISDNFISRHFSDGQIRAFMRELEMTYEEALMYLWFYNYVSICPKDLKTDNGRPMYRAFAKCFGKLVKKNRMSEIDVSKCEQYDSGNCLTMKYFDKECECEEMPNCYYKQLQELKQQLQLEKDNVAELNGQCESLKGLITVGGNQQFALTQRVDELEQKLEKIKNYIMNTTDLYSGTLSDILQIIEGDNNE